MIFSITFFFISLFPESDSAWFETNSMLTRLALLIRRISGFIDLALGARSRLAGGASLWGKFRTWPARQSAPADAA